MSQHRLAGFLGHGLFVDGFGILLAAFGFLNPVLSHPRIAADCGWNRAARGAVGW